MNSGYVYIITNPARTVLYTGVTNDIERRILEHKAGVGSKFAHKYQCTICIFLEELPDIEQAIEREKQIKNWRREWKLNLIKTNNPTYKDLAQDWFDSEEIENMRIEFQG